LTDSTADEEPNCAHLVPPFDGCTRGLHSLGFLRFRHSHWRDDRTLRVPHDDRYASVKRPISCKSRNSAIDESQSSRCDRSSRPRTPQCRSSDDLHSQAPNRIRTSPHTLPLIHCCLITQQKFCYSFTRWASYHLR
jgi:hypothetical protein